jgi:hypothetical protein
MSNSLVERCQAILSIAELSSVLKMGASDPSMKFCNDTSQKTAVSLLFKFHNINSSSNMIRTFNSQG